MNLAHALVLLLFACAGQPSFSARFARSAKAKPTIRRQSLQSDQIGFLPGLASARAEADPPAPSRIPHILHYIYLSGFEKFVNATKQEHRMPKDYYDSCIRVHSHWKVMFWTEKMAHTFVEEYYPWFLPVYDSYDMEIKRADAIRPLILHHYGGMYLDLDNQCYSPAEKLFDQYDVVLQGSGWEGVNNGMMASAPGHPIWMTLVEVLKERHKVPEDADLVQRLPIYMTGPGVLAQTVQRYLKDPKFSGFVNKQYLVDGLLLKVYAVGEFFMPCWGQDLVCAHQLEHAMAVDAWDMTNIVGRHWFAGTWNKPHLLNQEKKSSKTPSFSAARL